MGTIAFNGHFALQRAVYRSARRGHLNLEIGRVSTRWHSIRKGTRHDSVTLAAWRTEPFYFFVVEPTFRRLQRRDTRGQRHCQRNGPGRFLIAHVHHQQLVAVTLFFQSACRRIARRKAARLGDALNLPTYRSLREWHAQEERP